MSEVRLPVYVKADYATASTAVWRLLTPEELNSKLWQLLDLKQEPSMRSEMAKPTARFPDRKISETFQQFAWPVMQDLPADAPEHPARKALEVCFTVWNAVIFADLLKDNRHIEQIRNLTEHKPEMHLLIEQLIARKRSLFAADERMIGNWEVTRTRDGINLRADARDPYCLPRDRS